MFFNVVFHTHTILFCHYKITYMVHLSGHVLPSFYNNNNKMIYCFGFTKRKYIANAYLVFSKKVNRRKYDDRRPMRFYVVDDSDGRVNRLLGDLNVFHTYECRIINCTIVVILILSLQQRFHTIFLFPSSL